MNRCSRSRSRSSSIARRRGTTFGTDPSLQLRSNAQPETSQDEQGSEQNESEAFGKSSTLLTART